MPNPTSLMDRLASQTDNHILSDNELLDFADGQLDQIDSKVIASHILICERCAATATHYRALRSLVRGDDSLAPSLVTIAKAKAIYSEPHRASPRRWWSFDFSQLSKFSTRYSRGLALGFFVLMGALFCGDAALVVNAAQDTLPSQPLYHAKIASEKAQLAVAFDGESRVTSYLASANSRVKEIAALAVLGNSRELLVTVVAYEEVMRQVLLELASLEKSKAARVKTIEQSVDQAIARNLSILKAVETTMANEVKPLVVRAINFSQNVQAVVQQALKAKPAAPIKPPDASSEGVGLFGRFLELFPRLR